MAKISLIAGAAPEISHSCTELELHAYVDGELNNIEQAFVLESARQSAEIRSQLNELEQVKELVRISYAQI